MEQPPPRDASEPQDSLSNRRESPPFFGDRVFGVDKFAGSFPVARCAPDGDWESVNIRNRVDGSQVSRSATVRIGPGQYPCMVGVADIPATGQQWAKVELNPARVWDPDGHSTASAAETVAAVDEAISAAISEGLFEPAISQVEDVNVKRLDVTRDFTGVDDAAALIGGLIGVHRSYGRQSMVYYDPSRKGAQTLRVGGKADLALLYDKATETDGAAAGTVRFEARCRGWLSRYGGIRKVSELDQEHVEALGLDRFDWSGMGTSVESSVLSLADRVRTLDVSPTVRQRLIGYLVERACGYPQKMSNDAAARYRRLAREAGVALALDGIESEGPGLSMRLDVDEGRAVVEVG